MAVVAGITFFVLRALFALMPAFSSRHPIKKWAALAALGAAAFYLVLSGAEVATQRSFIMIAIVLIGVMVDRPTLTFRTLTVAAFGVLLLAPEGSSQLSDVVRSDAGPRRRISAGPAVDEQRRRYAIDGEDRALARDTRPPDRRAARPHRDDPVHRLSLPPHLPLWRDRQPDCDAGRIRLDHAGRNSRFDDHAARSRRILLAADGWWHRMDGSRRALSDELPGGVIAAFDAGPLLLCTAGLVVLACSRPPCGSFLIGGAAILMIRAPQPDVLIAADGTAVALRGENGQLSMVKSGSDVFTFREWLAADADARTLKDATLGEGIRCDAAGWVGKLRDGSLVAIVNTVEAFEEDCRRAVLVVSARDAPLGCATLLVDRNVWRRSGAMALRRRGDQFEITATRPPGYDRHGRALLRG